MADYQFLVADLADQTVVDEVPFTTFRWEDPITGPGSFSATLPLRAKRGREALRWSEEWSSSWELTGGRGDTSIYRGVIEPNRTEVWVERDGVPLWSGIVLGVRMQDDTLTFDGVGLRGYFDSRLITETRTYSAVDQFEIARDLIEWAQGNGSLTYGATAGPTAGDIGLTVASGSSGVTRDRTYNGFQYKEIGRAVEQLTELQNGFDLRVSRSRTDDLLSREIVLSYPAEGRDTSLVFDLPGQIEKYTFSESGRTYANDVTIIGEGEGSSMLIGRATDVGATATYPLWQRRASYKDISVQSTLDARAASLQRSFGSPPKQATLTLRGGLGSWIVGDEVTVQIDDGYVLMDGRHRIVKQTVTVDDSGKESIDVDVITADQT